MLCLRKVSGLIGTLLVPLLALPQTAQAQVLDSVAVDRIMTEALQAWQVPGVAVVIVLGDRVVYLKGFGVKQAGGKDAVTPDTVFALGSCSKPFTTLALAMLVDEGKLHWDDPVRRHLEFFRLADPLADANVTLRDLLTHRTGVASHDLLWYRAPWSQEEMIRKIGKVQPSSSFRSAFQYQSILFSAAGRVVGTASGGSWESFVQQRIFAPLQMTSASVTTDRAAKMRDRASPHRRNADGKAEVLPRYTFREPNPAGSINASARDLGNFLRCQLAEGVFQGKRLVSAESLLETRTPQIVLPLKVLRDVNPHTQQMSYGMGWVIQDYRGHLLHLHGGAIDGFRVQMTLVPEAKLGIAVLNNLEETQMNMAVTNSLLDLLLDLRPKDWNAYYGAISKAEEAGKKAEAEQRLAKRHQGTRPARELSAYVGSYEDPAYGTARVTLEDGGLVWHWSTFRAPLEHFHFETFTARHERLVNVQVVFTLDADGEVARMQALDRDFIKEK